MDEEYATIVEHRIQNFFNFHDYKKEVSIKINDFILKCLQTSRFISFDNKIINFDNSLEYEYESGEILEVHTQPDSEICGVVIPNEQYINFMDEDYGFKLCIEDNELIMNDECDTKFKLKTVYCSKLKESQEQTFNSKFLINVFKTNLNSFCKVYMKKEFPICFEFTNKRIFVAPLSTEILSVQHPPAEEI